MSVLTTLTVVAAQDLIYVMIVVAAIWFMIRLPKAQRLSVLVYGIGTFALSGILAMIAAHLFYDPRPFMVSHIAPLIPHRPGNGFPSDHALLASAITFVVFRFDKRFGLALLLGTLLVGLARVHAGLHHLIDIIASIAIAILAATLMYGIDTYVGNHPRKMLHDKHH